MDNSDKLTIRIIQKLKKQKLRLRKVRAVYNASKKCEKLEYPTTIQLPITYKCNFDCVMCGMKGLVHKADFSAEQLGAILSDKLFTKITGVGINGGEPFLKKDLVACIERICKTIPSLQQFFFISNGYFTDLIIEKLSKIKKICEINKVKIDLSLSVDGVGKMQDFMRGRDHAWENVNETIRRLRAVQCYDTLNIICTITKYNVYNLPEMELWAKENKINVEYNIATVNTRINNESKLDDFTIFNDEKAKFLAREFFFKQAIERKSQKYYGLFLFIVTGARYAPCPCQDNEWVTLTPDCQLGYCATHSKNLGDASAVSAYSLFNGQLDYLERLTKEYCHQCSHYLYKLDKNGVKMFYNEFLGKRQ